MREPYHGIRRLLAALRRPDMLERLPLAVQIKAAHGETTAREVVIKVVDRAFIVRTPSQLVDFTERPWDHPRKL